MSDTRHENDSKSLELTLLCEQLLTLASIAYLICSSQGTLTDTEAYAPLEAARHKRVSDVEKQLSIKVFLG